MTKPGHILVVTPQAVGEWWCEAVERASAGCYVPRQHQTRFVEWLGDKPGAMVAIGMGGGKTLCAIMATGVLFFVVATSSVPGLRVIGP